MFLTKLLYSCLYFFAKNSYQLTFLINTVCDLATIFQWQIQSSVIIVAAMHMERTCSAPHARTVHRQLPNTIVFFFNNVYDKIKHILVSCIPDNLCLLADKSTQASQQVPDTNESHNS